MSDQVTWSAAASTPEPARSRRAQRWFVASACAGLIGLGFAGLDGWFYRHVSCVLETKNNLTDVDFYTATRPLWIGLRTLFGYVYGALGLAVLALLWRPLQWPRFAAGLAVVLVTAGLANVAQGAIGRLRPDQARDPLAFTPPLVHLLDKENVCFPSGEVATAFALAVVFGRVLPRWRGVGYAVAALVAVARLVNGAHYVSDVVGGAWLGVVLATWLAPHLESLAQSAAAPARSRGAARTDREMA